MADTTTNDPAPDVMLPPMPPSRRSSSVSSATTVAALRTPGFRSRAVHSADEKRVTFRATPSVRYFNSTHSASFGSDVLDDENDEISEQDPHWRAMRTRRTRRQLKAHVVETQDTTDVDEQTRQLALKIAETTRQTIKTAVTEVVDGSPLWKVRGDMRRRVIAGEETTSQTWERRHGQKHQVMVSTTLPCRFRELQRVLETTRVDELEAALLACTHERIERTTMMETVETTSAQIADDQLNETAKVYLKGHTKNINESQSAVIKRVVLPRTKMAEAAQAWRRMRREETTVSSADEKIEFIDVQELNSNPTSAKEFYTSRVLQQMVSISGADHALLGDMQVGYAIQPDSQSSHRTAVMLFISRKRKATKSFAWSAESVSDNLVARLNIIPNVLWSYVERRRFGFQGLTYPDIVYCVSDIEEVQAEVTHCPLCASEFGFLRHRHFCHLCALWVCAKCSSDEDVERDCNGWVMENVKVCSACQDRVQECVFDYDRGVVQPAQPMIRTDSEGTVRRYSRFLAESWFNLLQNASDERHQQACTHVLDTLMTLLSPEDEHNFRLSGLHAEWEDLAPDEMVESVEELAENLPVPVLVRRQCVLSHDSTRRQYVLLFDEESGVPQSPTTVDDADRVKRVEKLSLMDIPSYPSLDILCALAATSLHCEMAFVTVITTNCSIRLATFGTSVKERERDDGFCAYTLQSMHPLVVLDMARDMRSRHFTLTTEENARFYCGVPLLSPDDTFVVATFAVVGTRPREAFTTTAYTLFSIFARAARMLLIQELEERRPVPASCA